MAHTPGSWYYDGTGCIYSKELPRADCVIAELQQASEDWEADGRLLASAPDLLNICKRVAAAFDSVLFQDAAQAGAMIGLRRIIDQAEGRGE